LDTFSRIDTIPECDGHPASHPASHVAVAITLNAQASSLKILHQQPPMVLFVKNLQGPGLTWSDLWKKGWIKSKLLQHNKVTVNHVINYLIKNNNYLIINF